MLHINRLPEELPCDLQTGGLEAGPGTSWVPRCSRARSKCHRESQAGLRAQGGLQDGDTNQKDLSGERPDSPRVPTQSPSE